MMKRPIYIFEDDDFERFYPLTVNRAVYQLRLGIDLLFEKWSAYFNDFDLRFCIRGHLTAVTEQRTGVRCNVFKDIAETGAVFVNGRFIPDTELAERITSATKAELILCNGNLVAAIVFPDSDEARDLDRMQYWGYGHFKAIVKDNRKHDVEAREVRDIWDFIKLNPQQITIDFERITESVSAGLISSDATVDKGCLIRNGNAVFVGPGAAIDGQVVIDARGGPVFIDSGAMVQSHTRIEGPCYVGRNCMLVGCKIREGCSFGPVCKVGGELEETIFLGYSNKFHDGFIGHAYLGEWVNLGAMTTNSDLKNNYGSIRVDRGEGQVDTGMMKVGSFIGDHVKTGIGTMLNTGITVGFASNLFGAGLIANKCVPPFCWGATGNYAAYDLDKAIGTARAVTGRRDIEFTQIDERVFRQVFDDTQDQREKLIGTNKGSRC
jgi:UDP-N-acetylglucosamine diphosphorylase/glucosamine-1-phosphate N-acetyltransferase